MQILLIDGIGPFFRHYKRKRINWSKIPFHSIETDDGIRQECLDTIPGDFERFVDRAVAMGYNAVSLDDLAHLTNDLSYPPALQRKLAAYRQLYRRLFQIAAANGMTVYITTDIMFFNKTLRHLLGSDLSRIVEWLKQAVAQLFSDFPETAGVIMRVGETDGIDVDGEFRSRMALRTPRQARRFLQELLPVFETHDRHLIFRTWSIGAYPIGDLMWNRNTFDRVFKRITSPNLIISMKYGESDFFRYLPLNKLFYRSAHRKLIEFQARREYEGFGAYPSFIGWDTEAYLQQLQTARNVVGVSVWCQTGGWGKRRQLTFIRHSSPWVELNAFVIGRLCQGVTCDAALAEYAEQHGYDPDAWHHFLQLSEDVIKDLLYIRELGERKLFFRRLRLPPQLYVFWDRIIINHTLKRILKCLVTDPDACLQQGRDAMAKLDEMLILAEHHGFPRKGLRFQHNTFRLLAAAREYFFTPFTEETVKQLEELRGQYRQAFRRNYAIILDFREAPVSRRQLRLALALLLRRKRGYRLVDRVFTLHFLAWLHPLIRRWQRRLTPKFTDRTAMGLDALFK